MIILQNRLDNFLEGYIFYPNSVDFRIVSSKALEKFKNIQAFQLNEIRNGKYRFGKSRRELLLLKFDLITKVLHEAENLCIQCYHDNNLVTDYIINAVSEMIYKAKILYSEIVLEKHPDSFDLVFSKIWIQIIDTVESVITEKLQEMRGAALETFFGTLVDIISGSLQNSTFELFELDVQLAKQGHMYAADLKRISSVCGENIRSRTCSTHKCPNASTCDILRERDIIPKDISTGDELYTKEILKKVQGDNVCDHSGKCLMLVLSNQTN